MKALCRSIVLTLLTFAGLWLVEIRAQENGATQTKVALIGTIHHFHLLHPDNTPAHLRAILERVRADAIAVENPPEWQQAGRHFWTQLPEYSVAEGYARERQIPIHGVDWIPSTECHWMRSAASPETRDARFAASRPVLRNLGAWESLIAFGDGDWRFSRVQDRIELARMEAYSREQLSDSAAILRHDRIANEISALAGHYRGRRLVVLFGSSQLYPLKVRLQRDARIVLVDARQFLPAAAEIEKARDVVDAVLLLGASLDGWALPNMPQARDHQRSQALLGWLESRDTEGTLAAYYRAKWHMLFGRYEDAARLLDRIRAAGSRTELPWLPNSEWSWPPWRLVMQKALFARATLHDLMGEHLEAARLYRELLERVPDPQLRPRFRGPDAFYDLRTYLEDLVRDPYRGGSWEAFRAQESLRCWDGGRIPTDAWPR